MSVIDTGAPTRSASGVTLGLRANWRQFALLVLINAFVGGMVGVERTVVPLIGSEEFHLASTTLVVSFIVNAKRFVVALLKADRRCRLAA